MTYSSEIAGRIFPSDIKSEAGKYGGLIRQKYITPVTASSQLELIPLYPDAPAQADILCMIREAFQLSADEFGYELQIRDALSRIWLKLLQLPASHIQEDSEQPDKAVDKIKSMMIYIHEHFAEKITVQELAAAAFISERECYRVFRQCLHMTPLEYMKSYRLQMACQMLVNGQEPITEIGQACGLGSGSYFGKRFREHTGCTPMEYRRKWQDNNKM